MLKQEVDDDPVTDEDLMEIQRGAQQVERGEFVILEELESQL
jgi:hypothetical protein